MKFSQFRDFLFQIFLKKIYQHLRISCLKCLLLRNNIKLRQTISADFVGITKLGRDKSQSTLLKWAVILFRMRSSLILWRQKDMKLSNYGRKKDGNGEYRQKLKNLYFGLYKETIISSEHLLKWLICLGTGQLSQIILRHALFATGNPNNLKNK